MVHMWGEPWVSVPHCPGGPGLQLTNLPVGHPTAFYTSRYGYKMCLRIYLNGDGTGRGTHLSLFFVVMRGPHDALLRWPFNQKVRGQRTGLS